MAEQIIQTLGFDASSAITTINTLNKSLAGLNTQLNNVAKAAKTFNAANLGKSLKAIAGAKPAQSLNNAATAAGNLGQKITQAGNQGGQALNNLNKQSKSLTISWQTLSRIIVAQTIVRGFNAITGSIKNSITETRDLQKRIGEIQTIAGGALGSTSDIAAGLQVTAETFGFDILDVAEAKYQELSNQVDGSTESLEFQTSAAKLARITNTKLTGSVSALSSVLNAFGLNATNSASAAGLLFKTVEQGRIRLPELASALGRVAPTANALGIQFNEVGASIARITQGGVRADTAITQFGGILNKLLKPTDALKKAFNELGVSSALDGIQQSGGSVLVFLKKLQKVAGDDVSLATFFNNIRAIQGVLSLVGTSAEKTSEVFGELAITAAESAAILSEQFTTATANDAVTYEKIIQKLGGTFRELATTIIPIINTVLKEFSDIIESVRNNPLLTGVLLATAAGALVGMGFAATGTAAAVGTLTTAMGASLLALGPVALAFGAIVIVVTAFAVALKNAEIEKHAGAISRIAEVTRDATDAITKSKFVLQAQAQDFKDAAKEASKFGEQLLTLRTQAQEAVRALNSDFVDSSSSALNSLLKTRQGITSAIQKAVESADAEAIKSSEKVASIQVKKDDFLLKRRLSNLSDLGKAFELFRVSQDQVGSANDLIKGSTDLTDFDSAADLLERRLDLAKQGLAAANASGNRGAIARAEQQIVTALNDQIKLEKQRGDLIQKRKEAAEKAAAADKAQTKQLKTLIGNIQKELGILNKGGGILNDTQLDIQRKKVESLLDRLSSFGLDSEQIDLNELIGIQGLSDKFQKSLDAARKTISDGGKEINSELTKVFATSNALINDFDVDIAIGLGLTKGGPDQVKSITEALTAASKESDNLAGSQAKLEAAQIKVNAQQLAFTALVKGSTIKGNPFTNLIDNVEQFNLGVGNSEETLRTLLTKISDAGPLFRSLGRVNIGGAGSSDEVIKASLRALEDTLKARKELQSVEKNTKGDIDRLRELEDFKTLASANLESMNAVIQVTGVASEKTGQLNKKAVKVVETVASINKNWLSVNSSLILTAKKQDLVAVAAKKAEVASLRAAVAAAKAVTAGSGGAQGKMFGGTLYRAAGGTARGTDTIPAMLSPGEFVVNASSSRKFASQLNAINSGSNPVFRQEGGAVTNNTVNVGDINVNGTADPDDTARRVLSKIRREFRRGTASRF